MHETHCILLVAKDVLLKFPFLSAQMINFASIYVYSIVKKKLLPATSIWKYR